MQVGNPADPRSAAAVKASAACIQKRAWDRREGGGDCGDLPGAIHAHALPHPQCPRGAAHAWRPHRPFEVSDTIMLPRASCEESIEGISVYLTARSKRLLQECAYLCNMAVDPGHRRQGYGLLLLEAAEEIARLGGQRDLYLHLRSAHLPSTACFGCPDVMSSL